METAISQRWLTLAVGIARRCEASGMELKPGTRKLLTRLETDIGRHRDLLESAWVNESGAPILAVHRGKTQMLREIGVPLDKTIELFFPTALFASPEVEKPSFGTIQRAFVHIIDCILGTTVKSSRDRM